MNVKLIITELDDTDGHWHKAEWEVPNVGTFKALRRDKATAVNDAKEKLMYEVRRKGNETS